jgi:hypothetical protein
LKILDQKSSLRFLTRSYASRFLRPILSKFLVRVFLIIFPKRVTRAGKATNLLASEISVKMAERSEKSAKRRFASNIEMNDILTGSFASRIFVSLRSVILGEIKVDKTLVILPEGLILFT